MARARSQKRDEAYRVYADSGGQMKLADIAARLGVPDVRIRKWKSIDKWDEKILERSNTKKGNVPNPNRDSAGRFLPGNLVAVGHGAPLGNKNSVGHCSSAPLGNQNSRKHGFYSRFVPADDIPIIMNAPGMGSLDRELRLARYRLARMMVCQEKRKMEGVPVNGLDGDSVTLLDDFYEPLIQKQIALIARLERDLCQIQASGGDGSPVTIIDDLGGDADE